MDEEVKATVNWENVRRDALTFALCQLQFVARRSAYRLKFVSSTKRIRFAYNLLTFQFLLPLTDATVPKMLWVVSRVVSNTWEAALPAVWPVSL